MRRSAFIWRVIPSMPSRIGESHLHGFLRKDNAYGIGKKCNGFMVLLNEQYRPCLTLWWDTLLHISGCPILRMYYWRRKFTPPKVELKKILKFHRKPLLLKETFRYLVATLFSFLLSCIFPLLFHEILGMRTEVAIFFTLFIVFNVNFFVIRHLVFRSTGAPCIEFLKFFLTSALFRIGEYIIFLIAYNTFQMDYMILFIAVLSLSFVGKFVVHKSFVFRNYSAR